MDNINQKDKNVRIGSTVKKKKCYWMSDEEIGKDEGKICTVVGFNSYGDTLLKGLLDWDDKVPCDSKNYEVIKY